MSSIHLVLTTSFSSYLLYRHSTGNLQLGAVKMPSPPSPPAPAVPEPNLDTASPNLVINHLVEVELQEFLHTYAQNKKKAFCKKRTDMFAIAKSNKRVASVFEANRHVVFHRLLSEMIQGICKGWNWTIVKQGKNLQTQQAAMVIYEFLSTLRSHKLGAARLQDLRDRWPYRLLQASTAQKKKVPEDLDEKDLAEVADCAMFDLILEAIEQYSWGDLCLRSTPIPFGSPEDTKWNYL